MGNRHVVYYTHSCTGKLRELKAYSLHDYHTYIYVCVFNMYMHTQR